MTANRPPSALLREAVGFVNGTKALDLGAGTLQDSRYLLDNGFDVLAVDHVQPRRLPHNRRFAFLNCRFDQISSTHNKFDLVTAQWSLPFAGGSKARFRTLWTNIRSALVHGGVFTGQLFGNRDAWAEQRRYGDVVFHTRKEVKKLLKELEVLHFGEVERLGREVGRARFKHWHYFNIIARKQ